jgi:hypothetical protein
VSCVIDNVCYLVEVTLDVFDLDIDRVEWRAFSRLNFGKCVDMVNLRVDLLDA